MAHLDNGKENLLGLPPVRGAPSGLLCKLSPLKKVGLSSLYPLEIQSLCL